MIRVLIFILLLTTNTQAQIHKGLETTLPLDFVKELSFQPFENYRERPKSPLAAKVIFDGSPLLYRSQLLEIFSEVIAVYLPENKKIKETKDSEGRKIWNYPNGTILIHEVAFRDDMKSPFELRILKKFDNRWAFGMYFPERQEYRLQAHTKRIPKKYFLAFNGKEKEVQLEHLQTHTCQACHANTTAARYQYPSLQETGPCELTPNNPMTKEWRLKYQEDPIQIMWK